MIQYVHLDIIEVVSQAGLHSKDFRCLVIGLSEAHHRSFPADVYRNWWIAVEYRIVMMMW